MVIYLVRTRTCYYTKVLAETQFRGVPIGAHAMPKWLLYNNQSYQADKDGAAQTGSLLEATSSSMKAGA